MAAAKKSSKKKKKKKSRRFRVSKFRPLGKYFLIILLLVGQAFLAYTVVSKNYEQTYSFLNSFGTDDVGMHTLEKLIVNPADTNGQRYLLVEITLELVNTDDVELIQKNKSKIRHDLIEFLSSRAVDQLGGLKEKEELRVELVKIVNNAIGVRSVRNLYYTKYVMQ